MTDAIGASTEMPKGRANLSFGDSVAWAVTGASTGPASAGWCVGLCFGASVTGERRSPSAGVNVRGGS